jgi:hypothetical protein
MYETDVMLDWLFAQDRARNRTAAKAMHRR